MAHPEHDCEDCGRTHFPWSSQRRAADRRERDFADAVLLGVRLAEVVNQFPELDRETVAEVLDALSTNTLYPPPPGTPDLDAPAGGDPPF